MTPRKIEASALLPLAEYTAQRAERRRPVPAARGFQGGELLQDPGRGVGGDDRPGLERGDALLVLLVRGGGLVELRLARSGESTVH